MGPVARIIVQRYHKELLVTRVLLKAFRDRASNHNSVENHMKTVYNAPQKNSSAPGYPRDEQVWLFTWTYRTLLCGAACLQEYN